MRKSRWIKQDRLEFHKKSFFDKTFPEPNTGCWLWAGAIMTGGYGFMKYNSDIKSAHRFSFFIHNNDFNPSLCVLHKCDVRCCVNPDHLFQGTYSDNAKDRESKKRGNLKHGIHNGRAKLTDEKVKELRLKWSTGEYSQRQLAKEYGVDQAKVWSVLHNKSWKHVL